MLFQFYTFASQGMMELISAANSSSFDFIVNFWSVTSFESSSFTQAINLVK